jgi:hypothetical protein
MPIEFRRTFVPDDPSVQMTGNFPVTNQQTSQTSYMTSPNAQVLGDLRARMQQGSALGSGAGAGSSLLQRLEAERNSLLSQLSQTPANSPAYQSLLARYQMMVSQLQNARQSAGTPATPATPTTPTPATPATPAPTGSAAPAATPTTGTAAAIPAATPIPTPTTTPAAASTPAQPAAAAAAPAAAATPKAAPQNIDDLMHRINEHMAVYQMLERQSGGNWRFRNMLDAQRQIIASLQLQLQRMLNQERLAESRELTARRMGYTTGVPAAAAENRARRDASRPRQNANQPTSPMGPNMPPGMTPTPFGPMIGGMTQTAPQAAVAPEVTMLSDAFRYRHDPNTPKDADGQPMVERIPLTNTQFGSMMGRMTTTPAAQAPNPPQVSAMNTQPMGLIDMVMAYPEVAAGIAQKRREQEAFDYANKDISDDLLRAGLATPSELYHYADPNTGVVTQQHYERVSGHPLRIAVKSTENAGAWLGDQIKNMAARTLMVPFGNATTRG